MSGWVTVNFNYCYIKPLLKLILWVWAVMVKNSSQKQYFNESLLSRILTVDHHHIGAFVFVDFVLQLALVAAGILFNNFNDGQSFLVSGENYTVTRSHRFAFLHPFHAFGFSSGCWAGDVDGAVASDEKWWGAGDICSR